MGLSCITPEASTIALPGGLRTTVDAADLPALSAFRWRLSPQGYVVASRREAGKPTVALMHRVLLAAGPGQEVDHINGDRLDNRRANLRLCSRVENARNRQPTRRARRSGVPHSEFKGVRWDPSGKRVARWRASIRFDGRQQTLGRFVSEVDAAKAYDAAAAKAYGAFARLNFPSAMATA